MPMRPHGLIGIFYWRHIAKDSNTETKIHYNNKRLSIFDQCTTAGFSKQKGSWKYDWRKTLNS